MSWPVRIINWSFSLLFILVPLAVLPYTSELFEFNKIIVTYALTTLIVTAWAARCVLAKRLTFRRTRLDLPLLLFLASQFVSLLFSIDPRTSLLGYYGRWNGGLLSLLAYAALYWAFVSNLDRKSAFNSLRWALFTTAAVSIYGVAQAFGIDDHLWVQDVKNRIFSTLGQPNWLAAYLVALIFIPVTHSLQAKNKKSLLLASVLALLLYVTLLFTKSRSGLLAFAASWIVYWGLTVKKSGLAVLIKKPLVLGMWSALIVAALIVPNPARDRIFPSPASPSASGPALETGGTESGTIRHIVWIGAVNIWRSSPKSFWLGTGPETFAMAYYQHRPLEHNATSEWEFLYNKAHNEFLNYLATTGLLGLLSYLLLLSVMAWTLLKNLQFAMKIALFSGWISLSVTNFWGFSVVPTQLLLFLLPAIAISSNLESEKTTEKRQKLTNKQKISLGLCGLLALWLLYSLTKYWLADFHFASSQKSLAAFSTTSEPAYILDAYQSASTAFNLNPHEPGINLQLGETAAYLAIFSADTDAAASAGLVELALTAAQRATDGSPLHPSYYRAQSRVYILLSALDNQYLDLADESLAAAARLSPTDPRVPYNRAIIAKYQNDTSKTLEFLHESLALKSDFPDALQQLEDLSTPSSTINR